jgi:cytoskeletal protein CcmA (bactofilin family)
MSSILINGRVFAGKNLRIVNGKIFVDGNEAACNEKVITIVVEGSAESVKVDACEKVTVNGDVKGNVSSMSGDIEVKGSVSGNASSMSGDVVAGRALGSISSMSGSAKRLRS